MNILRGPQSTLFGRNTIGGAIDITTVKPDENLSAKLQATMGSDDRLDAKASINLPLADGLYSRISVALLNRDGYVKRGFDGKELGDDETLTAPGRVVGGLRQRRC